jgi:hypothetical protein
VKLELMAFLAFVINSKIPTEDPLDFQITMRKQFKSAPLLRILVYGHIQCLLEGIKPPQYVRIMIMADRGLLKTGLEPAPTERDPWGTTWFSLMEMFPNRRGKVVEIAKNLNQKQDIITELPVTRQDAKISNRFWIDRFSLVRNALMMRGYVQDNRIGLVKLAYIGAAHRWPHRHLAWSARLGNPETKPPFIQIMILPPTAAERVMRFRPNLIQIDWSSSQTNYQLYDTKRDRWKTDVFQILRSVTVSKTMSHLERGFGVKRKGSIVVPTMDEATMLDFVSWGLYLPSLELGFYDKLLNMSKDTLKKSILKFKEQGVLQLQYLSYFSGLVSLCLEIKGDLGRIYSLTRASLLHLPSATAMISSENKTCYILGRVSEDCAYEILTNLPIRGKDHDLSIRSFRMTAYVGYINNLYQRLLKSDGTWDDDVSDFISQIRS